MERDVSISVALFMGLSAGFADGVYVVVRSVMPAQPTSAPHELRDGSGIPGGAGPA